MLEQLAKRVRGAVGVAHDETPGAAQLRIHVAARLDVVLDERADQRVHAVAFRAVIVALLGVARHEAGVVDEKAHIGEALRDHDVAALAVLVGLPAEGNALVHADHLHAQRACALDETDTCIVRQEEALAVRAHWV